MTFNENANVGGNNARRRGRTAAVAGGGVVGLGAVAVLVISLLTGQDLSGLLGGFTGGDPGIEQGAGQGGDPGGTAIENCTTGQDANENDACRLAAASLSIDQFWGENIDGYREPTLIIVDGETASQCGTASNATGPFYCPPEETIYVDPTFFALLRSEYDAESGPLAQLYVLAHEYGHHVQQITGIMRDHPDRSAGASGEAVRLELQADCYGGAWVASAAQTEDEAGVPFLKPPTQAQINGALDTAAAVGDDHIQSVSGGAVNPERWTHGASEQRQRWFDVGYQQGIRACDTFVVPAGSL